MTRQLFEKVSENKNKQSGQPASLGKKTLPKVKCIGVRAGRDDIKNAMVHSAASSQQGRQPSRTNRDATPNSCDKPDIGPRPRHPGPHRSRGGRLHGRGLRLSHSAGLPTKCA